MHTTLAVAIVALSMPACSTHAEQPARLQGTFIQLLNQHSDWKKEQWAALFASLRKLGVSHLMLQWSVYNQSAFYAGSQQLKSVANPPIETIFQMAEKADIQVTLGLVHDDDFWKNITRSPADVDAYLKEIHTRSITVAKELAPVVKKSPSFRGWYIPQEIDDLNWRKPEAQQVLFSYVRNLSAALRQLTPQARIDISGFANAGTDPKFLEGFWKNLLQTAPALDRVLLQDGIGVGKLKPSTVGAYFQAVKAAADSQSRQFGIIVEIFRQVGGHPVSAGSFRAVPATVEQIQTQLSAAAPYSTEVIAFSIPEYMSPAGGNEAKELFEAYVAIQPLAGKNSTPASPR